jgi:hypothetical protein
MQAMAAAKKVSVAIVSVPVFGGLRLNVHPADGVLCLSVASGVGAVFVGSNVHVFFIRHDRSREPSVG